MPPAIAFVLFLLALICFVLAAFSVTVKRVNLVALGLALVTVVWLWQAGEAAF
jgi:hypothetical protein